MVDFPQPSKLKAYRFRKLDIMTAYILEDCTMSVLKSMSRLRVQNVWQVKAELLAFRLVPSRVATANQLSLNRIGGIVRELCAGCPS